MDTIEPDWIVTVCANCLMASCWHGDFYCDEAQTAGLVDKKASELRALGHENRWHFSRERIQRVSGQMPELLDGSADHAAR